MATSATFDGQSLWAGDCTAQFVFGGAPHAKKDDAFPGVSGSTRMNLGQRGRYIVQRGHIVAESHAAFATGVAAIKAYEDAGTAHTLIDNYGRSHANVVMQEFRYGPERTTADGSIIAEYEITYFQLIP